jgi:predicted Fe-Mo cluster-binding NifX family protein
MARIAITSEGPDLEDMVDPRFGRAGGFVIVDTESMQTEYVDNGGSQAMAQGAGIQAAENVAGSGVRAVLTGIVGPKAFKALKATGVKIAEGFEGLKVKDAVERFKAGDFSYTDEPGGGPGR